MPLHWNPSKSMGVLLSAFLLAMTWVFWDGSRAERRLQLDGEFQYVSQRMGTEIAHQLRHVQVVIEQIQALHRVSDALAVTHFEEIVRTQVRLGELPEHVRVSIIAHPNEAAGRWSHALVAKALQHSAATGQITLSEPMAIPKTGAASPQTALVLVGPLYEPAEPNSASAAPRPVHAWIAAEFDAAELVGSIFRGLPAGLGFDVYDGGDLRETALLYRSAPETARATTGLARPGHEALRREQVVPMGGRQWTVVSYAQTAFFDKYGGGQSNWMALLGACASLLIGGMVWFLGSSRSQAMQVVRQTTRDLQRSNADLKGILDALPDLMFELDLDGVYHGWWSPRSDLSAPPPELFIGKRMADVLPADACAVCQEVLRECNLVGHSSGKQIRLEMDGQQQWFELSAARKTSVAAKPRFIMLSHNITQRKLAEIAIIERTQQLDLALQGGNMGFWDWDYTSSQLHVNARWYSMLGLVAGEMAPNIGFWKNLVHPADRYKLERLEESVIRDPQGVEFGLEVRARHALGHYVWILSKGAVFSRDAQGRPLRIVGTHMDITANKRFEEKLRLNEYAIQAVTQGICITDLGGSVISVNDALCSITGYSREELQGNNCRLFQGPDTDPDTVAHIRRALQTRTIFAHEILNYRKDGSPFWNDLVIAPVLGPEAEITHFVGVTRDVSEKKRTDLIISVERNAIRMTTEQLRVLSRRLLEAQETERRRVAHELHDELGQSLTAIKINLLTEQNRRGMPTDAAALENVRIVENAIQQVRRIALALRPSMLDDLGLESALAWLVKTASLNRDIQIEFQCNMDQSRLPSGVETACFRIVQEALTNVRRHAHATRVVVSMNVRDGQLRLQIADNGIGLKGQPQAGEVAEPSLGLLGMRERAASLGGTMTVHSTPDQGTTVELRCSLPEPEHANE